MTYDLRITNNDLRLKTSIGGAISTIINAIIHNATRGNISFALAVISAIVAIWAGILTIRLQRLKLKREYKLRDRFRNNS